MKKAMTKKAKVLRMGYFPIPSLTERVVDNIFESLREGDIVVEGGFRELKAEVLNMVREEVLENAEYTVNSKRVRCWCQRELCDGGGKNQEAGLR